MSVLQTPRIYFKGEISWDPITTNNYDNRYEENTGETIYPGVADKVKVFREQAVDAVVTGGRGGSWNPHGTHRSSFFNTTVCGFDSGTGVEVRDPFINASVNFTGMLVDLDPYGTLTSQLFFDGMHFGVDGGYRILAPRTSRITARRINFNRNTANKFVAGIGSVVWQTSFAKPKSGTGGLRIDAFDSPILKTLAEAMEADDVLGLTVRFNTYRTVYYNNPNLRNGSPDVLAAAQSLRAKLKSGGFQPNPARSLLVGVVGVWREGEPAHEPGDRTLVPTASSPLGGAQARLDETTLTIDLANSVPEVDENLTKQSLGILTVVAVDPASQTFVHLGYLDHDQYSRAAYEASAGIVTLPLANGIAQDAAQKDIQLLDATGTPLLSEMALRVIPETPNLYLDERESATVNFQLYNRGRQERSQTAVTLFQMTSSGGNQDNITHVMTDDNGRFALSLIGSSSGITVYVPSLSNADQPQPGIGFDPQKNTYMYVRMRPANAVLAELEPSWANVYNYVLANWNAMAPCMDNWLKLDDPAQVKAHAQIIKNLTHPGNFENYRFMPVTRDMSAGQRTLLYRFLDAPDPGTRAKADGEGTKGRNVAALSRAMRSG